MVVTALIIIIYSINKQSVKARAAINNGIQISFILQELQISTLNLNYSVSNKMVDVNISSYHDSNNVYKDSCSVLNNITCKLPQVLDRNKINFTYYVKLTDPSYSVPDKLTFYWFLMCMENY